MHLGPDFGRDFYFQPIRVDRRVKKWTKHILLNSGILEVLHDLCLYVTKNERLLNNFSLLNSLKCEIAMNGFPVNTPRLFILFTVHPGINFYKPKTKVSILKLLYKHLRSLKVEKDFVKENELEFWALVRMCIVFWNDVHHDHRSTYENKLLWKERELDSSKVLEDESDSLCRIRYPVFINWVLETGMKFIKSGIVQRIVGDIVEYSSWGSEGQSVSTFLFIYIT